MSSHSGITLINYMGIVPFNWIMVPLGWIMVPLGWIVVRLNWIVVPLNWIVVLLDWIGTGRKHTQKAYLFQYQIRITPPPKKICPFSQPLLLVLKATDGWF